MPSNTIDTFVSEYVQSLHNGTAAIFAGAGLSIPAGLVNWRELLRSVAKELNLDVDKEDDLIALAQYHVNERGGRGGINQALVNEFSRRAQPTDNHAILSSLPIHTYWTTNYDTILEDSLRAARKVPDVKHTPENLTVTVPYRSAVVYKMHGDVAQPDQAVVTKDDYESFDASKRRLFASALQGDLVSKTFLFVGFSFSDPNLAYILARIRVLLGSDRREHYCLLRRVQRGDFGKVGDYQYAHAKQDLQVRDLRRYGIQGLLLDTFDDYTGVLRRIHTKYFASRVFISGSAQEYSPFGTVDGQMLAKEIARRLVQAGFGIVSGFGLGVGQYVVNGALEELHAMGSEQIDDRILILPFPQGIRDASERKRRWTAYRRQLLSRAGIAVFVFGNKPSPDGTVAHASGMEEEFEIAMERGMFPVPVGCTGSLAKVLFERVIADYERYYPGMAIKTKLRQLARKASPEDVASQVVDLVSAIRDLT